MLACDLCRHQTIPSTANTSPCRLRRSWWKMLPLAAAFKMALDVMLGHRQFGLAEGAIAVVAPTLAAIIFYFWRLDVTEYFSFFSALAPTVDSHTSQHDDRQAEFCPTFGEQGWSMLGGGLGLGLASLVTAAATLTYGVGYWQKIKHAFKTSKKFTVSLEIPQSSQYFLELLAYVKEKQLAKEKPQHVALDENVAAGTSALSSYYGYPNYRNGGKVKSTQQTNSEKPMFVPAAGIYEFQYNGKTFTFEIYRKRGADLYEDTMRLTTWGRSTTIFETLIDELKTIHDSRRVDMTYLYTTDAYTGYWIGSIQSNKARRNTDSVILEDGIMESLLEDVQDFFDSADWYTQFGIPYHRGYLLHGPPGTGKTSLVSAIAGHFNMNIGIITLSDPLMTDKSFATLLRSVPANTVLLLEDIDAAFAPPDSSDGANKGRHQQNGQPTTNPYGPASVYSRQLLRTGLTFSGLLNALDGIAAAQARVLFMTTNRIETLDPALIRAGRVDVQKFIGPATDSQISRMFKRFNAEATDQDTQRFVRGVRDNMGCDRQTGRPNPITLARLQEIMLKYKKNPSGIYSGLSTLKEHVSQQGSREAEPERFQTRQAQQNGPRNMEGGFSADGFEMVPQGLPHQNWPVNGFYRL